MDQASLVKSDRDVGAQVMEVLNRMQIPVTLCEWSYAPQLEEWQLIIATPWIDSKGPRTTYQALVDALRNAGVYESVPMRRVFIMGPDDPLVRVLQRDAKEQHQRLVHILRHGSQYSLIFAPHHGSGGPVPARRFSNPNDLRQFLSDDLHVKPSSIDEVFEEIRHSGAGSIYPVMMTAHQARKPGLSTMAGKREAKINRISDDQLFVERRPQGDYAVRKSNSERASAVLPTQARAIERARELNPDKAPLVERVRHTSNGKPDKWRKA